MAVFILLLTAGETADCDPGGVAFYHLFAALATHVEIEPALDDAEEVLALCVTGAGVGAERIGFEVLFDTPVEPADGAVHGVLHALLVGGGGGDHIIELHDDVGADGVLEVDGVLGGEQHRSSIVRGKEFDAAFGNGCKVE